MNVEITLTEKNPMWFLPEVSLYLTSDEPTKILDWSVTDRDTKRKILTSIRIGTLKSNKSLQELTGIPGGREEESKRIPAFFQIEASVDYDREAQKNVSFGAKKIREIVSETKDLRLVQTMLKLESEDKKRKSVLGWLHEKKEKLQKHVQALVADGQLKVNVPPVVFGGQRYEVVEEEEKEITIIQEGSNVVTEEEVIDSTGNAMQLTKEGEVL